jgi:hypothetical protein
LDQPALAHHPEHALAVHRPAQPAARPRTDHAVAVGRVRLGVGDDRRVDIVDRRPRRRPRRAARLGDAIEGLPADGEQG